MTDWLGGGEMKDTSYLVGSGRQIGADWKISLTYRP